MLSHTVRSQKRGCGNVWCWQLQQSLRRKRQQGSLKSLCCGLKPAVLGDVRGGEDQFLVGVLKLAC